MHPYKPAWWLPNGHSQTLWAALLRKTPAIIIKEEQLELPDGDFVDLHWAGGTKGPIVVVLHGLEGSIHSRYTQGILHAITEMQWRGVLMHFRNCSTKPNRQARSYHGGDTGDLDYLIQCLQQREPDCALAAIGYSLGGNVLLKWLGSSGKQKTPTPLHAAAVVSVPFDFHNAIHTLEHGFSRIYHWHLLQKLRQSALRKFEQLPPPFPPTSIRSIRSIREFDDKVTAVLHGFENVDHYYSVVSSKQYLRDIQIPTLMIHSEDDPFMTPEAIPQPEDLSASITLDLLPAGGHVGFISGSWPCKSYVWSEKRIIEYFQMTGFE
ncbi:MAG: hydrolase [SAR324 cluster bacterium]|nr:hydrolase [SAR324 cluster bacterium]